MKKTFTPSHTRSRVPAHKLPWTEFGFVKWVPRQLGDTAGALYVNSRYTVIATRIIPENPETHPEGLWLSIRTNDRSDAHPWRDFQKIKNFFAGDEWEAVEIYPAESRLVDTSNQYHLWCFPFALGFGFRERLVMDQEMINADDRFEKARQTPFEPHVLPKELKK
jgi:hypothetical protein